MKVSPSHILRNKYALASGLVLLVFLTYLPALSAGFIWDDDDYITENPALRTAQGLRDLWLKPGAVPQYYPLTFTSFWVEYHLWGLNPFGYHLVNVLLHGLNAALVFFVLTRLAVPGAWFAAALFAVHPVEVESVAWITERKNLLSAFFYGLALLAYLRFSPPSREANKGHWSWYLLSLGLFVCALFSKTVACSLPAVIVLLLWWKRGSLSIRDGLALVPMFVVGLAGGLLTAWLEKHHVGARGVDWSLTLVERFLIAGRALWFYSGKLVWPLELIFIYPRWKIDSTVWWQYLFPLAAGIVLVSLWLTRVRLGKGPLIAVLFFCGTLLPALGFFDVYPMRYSFVADHFQYLASVGLFALLGVGTAALCQRLLPDGGGIQAILAAPVLVVLASLSLFQESTYQDLRSLWTDTIQKDPDCWMAHNNLGMIDLKEGDLKEAEEHLESALRSAGKSSRWSPPLATIHRNLGFVFAKKGLSEKAIHHYEISRKIDPTFPAVYYYLGEVAAQKGQWPEAREWYSRMLELDSTLWFGHLALGRALAASGKADEAIAPISEAIRLNPQHADSHYQLGKVLSSRGRTDEAVNAFQRAADLKPGDANYRFALGIALKRQGRTDLAHREYQAAMRDDPNWPAQAGLAAWTLATHPNRHLRDGPSALYLAELACMATRNRDPRLLDTLAAAHAEEGQFDRAVTVAREALKAAARDERLEKEIGRRIDSYKSRLPWRDSSEKQR